MKGPRLYTDIYRVIVTLLDPHTKSKIASFNKKLYSLLTFDKEYFLQYSSYFGLFISTFFIIEKYGSSERLSFESTPLERPSFESTPSERISFESTIYIDYALTHAARGGQIKLCKLLIHKGAKKINTAFTCAASCGHLKLCHFLIGYGATDFDLALRCAAYGGHIELCHILIKYGARDLDHALMSAAQGGRLNICRTLIEYGATDIELALASAKDEKTKNFLINERDATLR